MKPKLSSKLSTKELANIKGGDGEWVWNADLKRWEWHEVPNIAQPKP